MIYGYARISKKQQSIERQVRNIISFDSKAKIYQEAYTGTTNDRTEWQKLMKVVKSGDTIVFDSVSRMSRNAAEGFQDYLTLYDKGVSLIFLKEPHINTATYKVAQNKSLPKTGIEIADIYIDATNKVLMLLAENQIKLAFEQAEKEVMDLHQRTVEGIKTAKQNGKKVGRKTGAEIITKKEKAVKELILKHSKDFGGSLNDKELMELAKCSRNSFYKYKKQLKA